MLRDQPHWVKIWQKIGMRIKHGGLDLDCIEKPGARQLQ